MTENKRSRLAHLNGKITAIQRDLDLMGIRNSVSMTAEDRINHDIAREKLMLQRETFQSEYRRLVRDLASEELAMETRQPTVSTEALRVTTHTQRYKAERDS